MKIFKNILTKTDLLKIKLNYRSGSPDNFISEYHSERIDKIIKYTDIFYCDKSNSKLLEVVNKFIDPSEDIYSIHWIKYGIGSRSDRHLDRASLNTYIVLLNETFTGGTLVVNGSPVDYLLGDVVSFDGSKEYHQVEEITEGDREVLVVWTGNKQESYKI